MLFHFHLQRRASLPRLIVALALLGIVVWHTAAWSSLAWGFARSTEPDRPPGLTKPETLIRTARDLLKLFGMNEQRLGEVKDGDAAVVDGQEQYELTLRMLMAARRFSLGDQHRYAKVQATQELTSKVSLSRGEMFTLRGKIRSVTTERPEQHLADRFELPVYYRCEVELEGGQPAVIYALHVPAAWREAPATDETNPAEKPEPSESAPKIDPAALDERVGLQGLLLRVRTASEHSTLEFVTQRVAWYAPGPLGDLDGDQGLFETVRNNAPLELGDTACFYDLLAACGRASSSQLIRLAPDDFKVTSLFPRRDKQTKKIVEPKIERGELIKVTGTAQRAVKIQLEDPDKIAAYGFDHYFEVEVWHADALGNPLVFCLRRLPQGMPLGERIAVDVTVAGFFLKTWAYPISRVAAEGDEKTKFQIAPLLIGPGPLLVPREPPNPYLQLAGGLLFAAAVAGAWIGVAWSNREDKRFHDRVVKRVVIAADGEPAINELQSLHFGGEQNFNDYHNQAPLLPGGSDELPQIDTSGKQ